MSQDYAHQDDKEHVKVPHMVQQIPKSQHSTSLSIQFTGTALPRGDNTCPNTSEWLDFIFALLKQKIDLQRDAFIFNKEHSYSLISLATRLCLEEIL